MAVRALEIGTTGLGLRGYIPAPATLVGNQRQAVVISDLLHKGRVSLDRAQPVGDGQRRSAERRERLGDGLLCGGKIERLQCRESIG